MFGRRRDDAQLDLRRRFLVEGHRPSSGGAGRCVGRRASSSETGKSEWGVEQKPRRWPRRVGRAALALVAVVVAWLGLAIHPQPLFAFSLRRANVELHARAPLPPEAGPILDEAVRRLGGSPLYDPARVHHVFLCDTPGLFALFALWDRKVGATAQVYFVGNVFIRPTNIAHNRVIGPSGDEKGGERTLTYFIAHEVTHAMTADRIGRRRYRALAAFQQEGYADYVAFDHRRDLPGWRAALAREDPEMSPRRSGLYRRYELMVAYLLDHHGMTVDQLLGQPLDRARLEGDILVDPTIQ
jgi:hypothetical protein